MSFMSDFSEAFSPAYTRSFDRAQENETDQMKLQMASALKQKEDYQKQMEKDRKAASTAQSISEQYGAPLSPILSMLRAGVDPSRVEEQAKNGSWASKGSNNSSQTSQSVTDDDPASAGMSVATSPSNDSTGSPETNTKTVSNPMAPSSGSGNYNYSPNPKKETFEQTVGRLTQAAAKGDQDAAKQLSDIRSAQNNAMPKNYNDELSKAQTDVANGVPGAVDRLKSLRDAGDAGKTKDYNQQLSDARIGAANGDPDAKRRLDSLNAVGPQTPINSDAGLISLITNLEGSSNPEDQQRAQELKNNLRKQQILKAQTDGKFGNATMSMVITPDNKAHMAMVSKTVGPDGSIQDIDMGNQQPVQGNVIPYNDQMQKLDAEVNQNQRAQPVLDYKEHQRNAIGALRDGNELIRLAKQNPNIIAEKVGGVADILNTTLKEINAGVDEFITKNNDGKYKMPSSDEINDLRNSVNSIEPSSLKTFADQVAYFNAKRILFAYNAGQALGQSGRNFTQTDYENVMNATNVRTSDAAYADNMQSYLRNMLEKVNDGYNSIKGFNQPVETLSEINSAIGQRYQPIVQNLDNYVNNLNDPKIKEDYQTTKNSTSTTFAPKPQQPSETSSIPSSAIEYLKNNPNLKDAFDQKYGDGAAARYLGN